MDAALAARCAFMLQLMQWQAANCKNRCNSMVGCLRHTLTAERTTAQLACCRRGVTLSTMLSASLLSRGLYVARLSRMKTCEQAVPELLDTRNLLHVAGKNANEHQADCRYVQKVLMIRIRVVEHIAHMSHNQVKSVLQLRFGTGVVPDPILCTHSALSAA